MRLDETVANSTVVNVKLWNGLGWCQQGVQADKALDLSAVQGCKCIVLSRNGSMDLSRRMVRSHLVAAQKY